MGFLSRLRVGYDRSARPGGGSRSEIGILAAPSDRHVASHTPRNARASNALKDCLWHLNGIGQGKLLDLGPVWQSTVSFFIERGFKVYTEDLLLAWKEFLREEEGRLQRLPLAEEAPDMTPAARAERFLKGSLQYPADMFDAVLAWDVLDYLESDLAVRVVARLDSMLKVGGLVLALFHSRKPDAFYRYRVLDPQNLELVPATVLFPVQHIFQNREVLNLFERFHSSKTFIGRDQLREGLFVK